MPATINDVVQQADKVRRLNEKRQELLSQRNQFQTNIATINSQLTTLNAQLTAEVNALKTLCADLT